MTKTTVKPKERTLLETSIDMAVGEIKDAVKHAPKHLIAESNRIDDEMEKLGLPRSAEATMLGYSYSRLKAAGVSKDVIIKGIEMFDKFLEAKNSEGKS